MLQTRAHVHSGDEAVRLGPQACKRLTEEQAEGDHAQDVHVNSCCRNVVWEHVAED